MDQTLLTSAQKRELLRDLLKREGPVPLQPRKKSYPLSSAQLRMWFLHQLEPLSGRYHVSHAVRLDGPLDVEAFRWAVQQCTKRHDALRTTFRLEDGEPVQIVAPTVSVDLSIVEASESQAQRILETESARPFDLEQGPLIRTGIIRLTAQAHFAYVVMHHIVSDGRSLDLFLGDLTALAIGHELRKPANLPVVTHQYQDYAAWQRGQNDSLACRKQIEDWKARLSEAPPLLRLPTDRLRPERLSDRGSRVPLSIDDDTARGFREFCRQEGVTLYAGLLAAFQTFLARYSGEETIVSGFPVANRMRREWQHVIGFFANTVAVATKVDSGLPFRSLLQPVSAQLIEALAHQDLPFDVVVEAVQPPRSLSHHPIFQAVLLLEEQSQEIRLGPLRVSPVEVASSFTKFDLTLVLKSWRSGALAGYVEFSTDLFDASTIERMGRHFGTLLASIVANPDCAAGDLPLILPEEAKSIAVDWNATRRDYPRDSSVHRLFEATVRQYADATAIVHGARRVTYRELNSAANRMAHALLASGVKPGDRVAIALPQSVEAVVAILAVLKAGGVYLVLDPADISLRNDELVRDCGAVLTVTSGMKLDGGSAEDLPWDGSGSDAAYVMYTSGSTGPPKGVLVPHRAIARLVINTNYVDIQPGDRIAQISTLTFDAFTFELAGALLNGAEMVLIPREVALTPAAFAGAAYEHRLTIGFFTATLFNHLVSTAPESFLSFRSVLVGGEAVDPKWFARLFQAGYTGQLVNAYGPTEATTFSICNVLTCWENETAPVPVGRPIANSTAYVLSRNLSPVPPGVVGEICVGGDGVALGYMNDEAATREKFVRSPFVEGERLYRTGDLGRYRPNGEIECLGRMDRQLKIRGFRIEPGEVERTIESHPEVDRAAVIAVGKDSTERTLSAYVVRTADSSLSSDELHEWLQGRLPAYLVPARIMTLAELPLTRNGKLDETRLPLQETTERITRLLTPIESLVIEAWKRVLNVEQLQPEDDFFRMGGTSLSAMRMLTDLERTLGRSVPVALILRTSTVQGFARAIEVRSDGTSSKLFCIRHGDPSLPPVVLVHAGADYRDVLQELAIPNEIWSLWQDKMSGSPTLQQIAAHHADELSSTFGARPVIFGGYCLSGMVAFELARQRWQQTGNAAPVILFDVPSPRYYRSHSWPRRITKAGEYVAYQGKRWFSLAASERSDLLRAWRTRIGTRRLAGAEPYAEGINTEVFFNAARSYNPERYPGKVVLLRAAMRPADDRDLGWAAYAGSVEVHDTPCGHDEILKAPHAGRAADAAADAVSAY
jgi:amino acid adenylation domain-containing protein